MPIIGNNIFIIVHILACLALHRYLALILHNKIDFIIIILFFLVNLVYFALRIGIGVGFSVTFLLARGFDCLLVDCVTVAVLDVVDVETLEISADA